MSIHRVKAGFRVVSKKGKNMGTYRSKVGAETRLAQIERFKARAKTKKR